MRKNQCDIGMIGLGVMGRNLLLNMADHGFKVAGYDSDKTKVTSLRNEAQDLPVFCANSLDEFLGLLKNPRAIMLLVPAGSVVDSVINELMPHLQKNDLIIDAGNSHFTDTDVRTQLLQKKGIQFLGVGISGGEKGARKGPSIMPGGSKEAYEYIRPILEAVAAQVNGESCVTYMGNGSAGHFVKMVHNGIEYAIMQLIAESYDLLKRGLGLTNKQLHEIYRSWNQTSVSSFLIEITSHILAKIDATTGSELIDKILGVAKQKGTGMWTSLSAMELQVPVPTIDLAVSMREMSVLVKERKQAAVLYDSLITHLDIDHSHFINQLQSALFTGMVVAYAQGMALLSVASKTYSYQLNLESVARIWRGGCIIRATMLDDLCAAFHSNPDLPNVLLDPNLAKKINLAQKDLRQIVQHSIHSGIPTPTFMATLSYFDAYRSAWQPANLIQAQRDYFGAHTYERIDTTGTFHTAWDEL